MKKAMALMFIAVGLVLIIFGGNDYLATVGGFSRAFSGVPSDTAVWLLIAGLLAAITGIFGATGGHSKESGRNPH
jgi:hypothetical protein